MIRTRHHNPTGRRRVTRRGLTLLEALIASTVLSIVVLAMASAMGAAQKVSFEGQKRMLAAMAVDDMMNELMTLSYAELLTKGGTFQPVGEMETLDGLAYPESYWTIGREVEVRSVLLNEPDLGVNIAGLEVTVRAFDEGADLAEVRMFVAELAS